MEIKLRTIKIDNVESAEINTTVITLSKITKGLTCPE